MDNNINIGIYCHILEKNKAFLNCPKCTYYPCPQLTEEDIVKLNTSDLLEVYSVSLIRGIKVDNKYSKRKIKQYLVQTDDNNSVYLSDIFPTNYKDIKKIIPIKKVFKVIYNLRRKQIDE